MEDLRLKKYAQVIINYALYVKRDEWVVIRADPVAQSLVKEVYKSIIEAGAFPSVLYTSNENEEVLLKHGSDRQIKFENPFVRCYMEKADKILTILGSENLKSFSQIEPEKISMRSTANYEAGEIYHQRLNNGGVDWTLCLFPTNAGAQEAEMSLEDYEAFVFNACMLNFEKPEEAWKALRNKQEKYVNYLSKIENIHVVAPGTDLTLSVKERKWVNSDGHHNFPSGEVFTAPIESSVNGKIRFTFPGIFMGQKIEDVQLVFENGKVIHANAKSGNELLNKIIKTDIGASYVGEFAIGTNVNIDKFTSNMLFDEKIGGTIHLALGNAYSECGGTNKSAIHWDMLCDMRSEGRIYGDSTLFYKNGQFIFK